MDCTRKRHFYITWHMSLLYIIKLSQTVWELWPAQYFRFRRDNKTIHNEESKNCLSCTRHAYLSYSSSLPNIIKLSQTVWELWPAQDFCFRRDNHITNIVRVISLASNMPTRPPLYPYQILSKICLRVSKLWSAQGCVNEFLLQER